MTVAHVVPLRRLPSDHLWFDYSIPDHLQVRVGQLATVPLMRQLIPGVVWAINDHSEAAKLRPISAIVFTDPVMSPWQMRACSATAEDFCSSLAHVYTMVLPSWTKRSSWTSQFTTIDDSGKKDQPDLWWYTDRRHLIHRLASWAKEPRIRPRIIVTPTLFDLEELQATLGPEVITVHGSLSPKAFRDTYTAIAAADHPLVIGTAIALLMPYRQPPDVVVDQEEHPAHKQRGRFPYIDARVMARRLDVIRLATSPAPSISWWSRYTPQPQTSSATHIVADLRHPSPDIFSIAQATESVMTDTVAARRGMVIVVPRQGYAGAISCKSCGTTVSCPQCHRHVGIRQTGTMGTCLFCQRDIPLPATCPVCRGVTWQQRLLGLDHVVQDLRRWQPSWRITSGPQPSADADVWVSLPGAAQTLRAWRDVGLIVIAAGDHAVNRADVAAGERVWQALYRLQAMAPTATMVVQTFDPEADLWQRWRRNDHLAFYQHELAARREWHAPPMYDQWIARWTGQDAETVTQEKGADLGRHLSAISTMVLPHEHRRASQRPVGRLLITAQHADQPLTSLVSWAEWFPTPWRVEPYVDQWN